MIEFSGGGYDPEEGSRKATRSSGYRTWTENLRGAAQHRWIRYLPECIDNPERSGRHRKTAEDTISLRVLALNQLPDLEVRTIRTAPTQIEVNQPVLINGDFIWLAPGSRCWWQ